MAPKHKKAHFFSQQNLFADLTSFKELESRIAALPIQDRGNAFEVFAEAYFNTQKLHQAEEVWPFDALPIKSRTDLGFTDRDMGVDGAFRTLDDMYNAYQVKYRSNRIGLTWQELSTFMGLSDRVYKRILFTNTNDLPEVMKDRTDFYPIKGNDLDRLEKEDFQIIEEWLKTGKSTCVKKIPRPYQEEALRDITAALNNNDRTTAVMACGTGKTLISLWVAEQRDAQSILILLPSLALLRQTLHDWAKERTWKKFPYLCVCSDETVVKGDDEIVLHQSDLDFSVTTQKEKVAQFLKNSKIDRKIVFSTYQSSKIVAEAMPAGFSFDIGIFDEAHKTAGRAGTNFSYALKNENLSIKKRLFLTATPRHYNINKKDKEGDQCLVFSMDNEEVYGKKAHELSFAVAAEKEIICKYKVIISLVTSEEINRELLKRGEVLVNGDVIKANRVANVLAVAKAIEQFGVKHIFTFHNSVKSAESFTSHSNEGIGTYLENFSTLHVNGVMPTSKRELIMREFKETPQAILSNARCLTEGVDVPAVDMVAFISPKKSQIDIVQAAGRAMRKADGKELGYILIPLFLEMAQGETVEEALEKTKFDTVWDVLQAMQEQDESLVEIIGQMREEIGRVKGFNDNRLREKVVVLGPQVYIETIHRSITTKIVDKLGLTWDERFGELVRFKEEHKHCNVPDDYPENQALGTWVGKQRSKYKSNKLSLEQIKKLNKIGFDWDLNKSIWTNQLNFLKEFKKKNKRWPMRNEEFPPGNNLGSWCTTRRQDFKKGLLEDWQIKGLTKIGFIWDPKKDAWNKQFNNLKKFRRAHLNRWPAAKEMFPKKNRLGSWCDKQRQKFKQKKLNSWQITALNGIGFIWDPLKNAWDIQFDYLRDFREAYPNRWPRDKEVFPKGNQLGSWCGWQRQNFKKKLLESWQIKALNSIGFIWDLTKAEWEVQFNYLKVFRLSYPNRWPNDDEEFPKDNKLGVWCFTRRSAFKKGLLPAWQVNALNKIGFIWDKRAANWDKQFNYLREFREAYPNRWPRDKEEFPQNNYLGSWCGNQRQSYKKGLLKDWQIRALNNIGFEWGLQDNWNIQLNYLKEFRKLNPNKWPRDKEEFPQGNKLGIWCSNQRQRCKDISKKARLNEIEFPW